MRMRTPAHGSCDPIAPLELPHSLHAFHRVASTDTLNKVRESASPFSTQKRILQILHVAVNKSGTVTFCKILVNRKCTV